MPRKAAATVTPIAPVDVESIRTTPPSELSIEQLQALLSSGHKAPKNVLPLEKPAVADDYFEKIARLDRKQTAAARPATPAQPDDGFVTLRSELGDALHLAMEAVQLPDELLGDLRIDPDNLDQTMIDQPVLFARYAVMNAQAQANYEESKDAFTLLKAQADKQIRSQFAIEGTKVTDSAVEAAVQRSDEYLDGLGSRAEANRQMQVTAALREAFAMRATMVQMLVSSRNKEWQMTR